MWWHGGLGGISPPEACSLWRCLDKEHSCAAVLLLVNSSEELTQSRTGLLFWLPEVGRESTTGAPGNRNILSSRCVREKSLHGGSDGGNEDEKVDS